MNSLSVRSKATSAVSSASGVRDGGRHAPLVSKHVSRLMLALVILIVLMLAVASAWAAAVGPKCAGMDEGAKNCWKELSNQPGCYLLNDVYYPDQTVIWSGTCSGDVAVGHGTLTWREGDEFPRWTGSLIDGKKNEVWTLEFSNSSSAKGPYIDGKRNGVWTIDNTDSSRLCCGLVSQVKKGPYVDGVEEGEWLWRQKYENGDELIRIVPMVNGKKHGETRTFRDGKCIVKRTYLYGELAAEESC